MVTLVWFLAIIPENTKIKERKTYWLAQIWSKTRFVSSNVTNILQMAWFMLKLGMHVDGIIRRLEPAAFGLKIFLCVFCPAKHTDQALPVRIPANALKINPTKNNWESAPVYQWLPFSQRKHVVHGWTPEFRSIYLLLDCELTIKRIRSEEFTWIKLESSPVSRGDPQDTGIDFPVSYLTFWAPS